MTLYMTLLSLDPGLANSGYAFIDSNNNNIIKSGIIKTTKDMGTMVQRLYYIAKTLQSLCIQTKPDFIVFEQAFSRGIASSGVFSACYVNGILVSIASNMKIGIQGLNPSTVKKHYRKKEDDIKDKNWIIKLVQEMYNDPHLTNNHTTDAILLGHYFLNRRWNNA